MEVKEKQRHNEQIPYHPPFRTLCVSSPLFLFVRPCTRVGYARSPPSSELELVLLLPYYYYYHHHTPFTYYTPFVLIPVLGVLYYFEPSTPPQITNKAAFAVLKIERQKHSFCKFKLRLTPASITKHCLRKKCQSPAFPHRRFYPSSQPSSSSIQPSLAPNTPAT